MERFRSRSAVAEARDAAMALRGPGIESLDYECGPSRVEFEAHHDGDAPRRRVYGYSGTTAIKQATTLMSGIAIGVTAFLLEQAIEYGVGWRAELVQGVWNSYGRAAAVSAKVAVGALAAGLAAALVQTIAPKAAGAGVSPVMALLNGNDIPDLLTPRTFVIKWIGNVLARVSGLTLGPEGPMIHLGACVASTLSAAEDLVWVRRRARDEADAARSDTTAKDAGPDSGPANRQPPAPEGDATGDTEAASAGRASPGGARAQSSRGTWSAADAADDALGASPSPRAAAPAPSSLARPGRHHVPRSRHRDGRGGSLPGSGPGGGPSLLSGYLSGGNGSGDLSDGSMRVETPSGSFGREGSSLGREGGSFGAAPASSLGRPPRRGPPGAPPAFPATPRGVRGAGRACDAGVGSVGGSLPGTAARRSRRRPADPPSLFSNTDQRDIIAAGAAAGLASAFGAPVGGVLFALEEACSHWTRKTGWRCFLCCASAVFTLSQLQPGGRSGMLAFGAIAPVVNRQWMLQAPLLAAASALAGLLGATFNAARGRLSPFRASRRRTGLRILESVGIAVASALTFALTTRYAGRCMEPPVSWQPSQLVRAGCPAGMYNDAATLHDGGAVWAIRHLLGVGSGDEPTDEAVYFGMGALISTGLLYLALMAVTAGCAVPGGLFMPSIMVGATLGAAIGKALHWILPNSWFDIRPGMYAVVGATAMLAGVFRSSISLVVIVVEGTKGIDFLFGIVLAVVVSNIISQLVHHDGIYESELERDGTVFYLRLEPPRALRSLTARDVAASPAVGFAPIERVSRVAHALKDCSHNGFVVALPDGTLVGLTLRSQLEVLLANRAYCDASGRYRRPLPLGAEDDDDLERRLHALMVARLCEPLARPLLRRKSAPAPPPGVSPASSGDAPAPSRDAALASAASSREGGPAGAPGLAAPPSPGRGGGGEAQGRSRSTSPTPQASQLAYLNLEPYMNCAPLSVRPGTLATTVHRLFLALSLRHLPVTDIRGRVRGIITRKDLDHASGRGWWRLNPPAPMPRHADGTRVVGRVRMRRERLLANLAAIRVPDPRAVLAAIGSIGAALSPEPSISDGARSWLLEQARREEAEAGEYDDDDDDDDDDRHHRHRGDGVAGTSAGDDDNDGDDDEGVVLGGSDDLALDEDDGREPGGPGRAAPGSPPADGGTGSAPRIV